MPALLSPAPYEYAAIRVMPRVDRGEFVNAGVVLFSRTRRFLDACVGLGERREAALLALDPELDLDLIRERLAIIPIVCGGGSAAGPIGQLAQAERFRWVVAPASTIIQSAPVHSGLCDDPAARLEALYEALVGSR